MERKIVHIDIDTGIYEDLKIYCVKNKITIKALVKKLIVKQLKRGRK